MRNAGCGFLVVGGGSNFEGAFRAVPLMFGFDVRVESRVGEVGLPTATYVVTAFFVLA
jgi:hypothetical protein